MVSFTSLYTYEWTQRVEAFVGKSFPAIKRFFTHEKVMTRGHKYFSMDLTDVQVVQPLTREEENLLSTTQVKEHEWKMTDSREKLKEQTPTMAQPTSLVASVKRRLWDAA